MQNLTQAKFYDSIINQLCDKIQKNEEINLKKIKDDAQQYAEAATRFMEEDDGA